jgi:hypothetical protein
MTQQRDNPLGVAVMIGGTELATGAPLPVAGNVASGATDTGSPIKTGAVYNTTLPTATTGQRVDTQATASGETRSMTTLSSTTGGDAVTNTQMVGRGYRVGTDSSTCYFGVVPFAFNGTTWDRLRGDVNGLVTQPFGTASARWNYAAAAAGILNTTTAVTIMSAAGVGVRNYLTNLQVMAEALGAATELAVRDGAAGTVLWRTKITTAGAALFQVNFDVPLKGTANTLLEVVTLTASVTGAVYVSAQGYQGT